MIVPLTIKIKQSLEKEACFYEVNLMIQNGIWPETIASFDYKTRTVVIPNRVNLIRINEYFKVYKWCNKEIDSENCFRAILLHEIGHKLYTEMISLGNGPFREEKQDKFAYNKIFSKL